MLSSSWGPGLCNTIRADEIRIGRCFRPKREGENKWIYVSGALIAPGTPLSISLSTTLRTLTAATNSDKLSTQQCSTSFATTSRAYSLTSAILTTDMLSAKPMEPVALAFPASLPPSPSVNGVIDSGLGQDRQPSSGRDTNRPADRLHILTTSGRRLTTVPGQLPLDAVSASQSQSPSQNNSDTDDTRSLSSQHSRDSASILTTSTASTQHYTFPRPDARRRSSSKTDLLAVPEVDDTGKITPEQVSCIACSINTRPRRMVKELDFADYQRLIASTSNVSLFCVCRSNVLICHGSRHPQCDGINSNMGMQPPCIGTICHIQLQSAFVNRNL